MAIICCCSWWFVVSYLRVHRFAVKLRLFTIDLQFKQTNMLFLTTILTYLCYMYFVLHPLRIQIHLFTHVPWQASSVTWFCMFGVYLNICQSSVSSSFVLVFLVMGLGFSLVYLWPLGGKTYHHHFSWCVTRLKYFCIYTACVNKKHVYQNTQNTSWSSSTLLYFGIFLRTGNMNMTSISE